MAKQTAGFMGGFHGRLGPAVGYMWRGQWCVRAYNPAPRNPRTPEQVAHREMFKREVQLAASMSWAVNMGFKELAYEMHMTPYNLFVHLNQGAFSLVDNIFRVDYSVLRLSSGQRAAVAFGVPVWDEDNVLTVSFDNDGSGLRADRYDNVYLYAYCPDRESGFMASPVYRRAKKVSVALPDSFVGHEVHLYGMVCSADGMWSETVYAGCVTVKSDELRVMSETVAEPAERAAQNSRGYKPTETDEGTRAESRRDGTDEGGTPLGLT